MSLKIPEYSSSNETTIDGQIYVFVCRFYNTVDNREFSIKYTAISELVIEEDVKFWHKKGNMLLKFGQEVFEKRPSEDFPDELMYKFRNDGNDYLQIYIAPKNPDGTVEDDPAKIFHFLFAVYDYEDIPNQNGKQRRYFFWDVDYQNMVNFEHSWSSSEVLKRINPKINPSQCSDSERRVKTGELLKFLLNENNQSGYTIDPNFDVGGSSLFYCPSNGVPIINDFEYILKKHISSKGDNDLCIFYKDRSSGKYKLDSLAEFFSKAQFTDKRDNVYMDDFLLNATSDDQYIGKSILPYPVPNNIPLSRGIYGAIKDYNFSEMSAIDNIFSFVSHPVYHDNYAEKMFEIDWTGNDIVGANEMIKKNYVSKMKHNTNPESTLTLNSYKIQQHNVEPCYSFSEEQTARLADGRNMILEKYVHLNNAISFYVKGLIDRQPMRFMGIIRPNSIVENDFDSKITGVWFVTNVKHVFMGRNYQNVISGVKLHNNRNTKKKIG